MNASSTHSRWVSIATVLVVLVSGVSAQNAKSQQQDEDFARSVKEWTTKPELASPVREVIRIYRNEHSARFIALPVAIK